MRVLITGNMGYVGPVVAAHLRRRYPEAELIGYDSGLFGSCLTTNGRAPETTLTAQYFGDVRDLSAGLLRGVDAVVHLAAVSNDPIGNRFEAVTDEINRAASLRTAALAAAAGVRAFVFASSCSVYGAAEGVARRETDALNPLTAYARSKVATEEGLAQMDLNGMTATSLRFATACGMSDRLRLDLVLNDFTACALTAGEITVLSDGTPWRPLIDVRDMALAIEWAIERPAEWGGRVLQVNVGGTIVFGTWPRRWPRRCRVPPSASTRRRRLMRDPIGWIFPCSVNSPRRTSRASVSMNRLRGSCAGCIRSASAIRISGVRTA